MDRSTSLLRILGVASAPVLSFLSSMFGNRKKMKKAVYGERQKPLEPTSDVESVRLTRSHAHLSDFLTRARSLVLQVLMGLDTKAEAWRGMSLCDKAVLFRRCIGTVCEHGERIAELSTRAKGQYGSGIGEEILSLIPIVTFLSEVADNFDSFESTGRPNAPCEVTTREGPDEQRQRVVDVFPMGLTALALGGFKGELWICPGYDVTQGEQMRHNEKHTEPGVGLVLGAGNHYPLAVLDILHVLVTQSRVVVCKLNPVNEYIGPMLRLALEPLVSAGFVEFVYGGADVGAKLVDHPLVKSIHLTGSEATYDSIVWKGQDKTKATGPPPLRKHVGAELGCVTPYIIVPGEWDDRTIEYHAANVVAGTVHNAGHNCLGAEVLVTDASWPQRQQFLDAVRRQLAATSKRSAYYPGSETKFSRFEKLFPDCESYGQDASPPASEPNGPAFSWKLKTGLSPATCAVDQENWCGVLQEVSLDCADTADAFFKAAASFANETCWGTLSCAVLVDAHTQHQHQVAFDAFIAALRYGSVCVNVPCMIGFGITRLSWGAWGDDTEDRSRAIGSGNEKVHNSGLFDHVQKSVLFAPSVTSPPPYWHVSNKNVEETGRAALDFFRNSSVPCLVRLVNAAVHG